MEDHSYYYFSFTLVAMAIICWLRASYILGVLKVKARRQEPVTNREIRHRVFGAWVFLLFGMVPLVLLVGGVRSENPLGIFQHLIVFPGIIGAVLIFSLCGILLAVSTLLLLIWANRKYGNSAQRE